MNRLSMVALVLVLIGPVLAAKGRRPIRDKPPQGFYVGSIPSTLKPDQSLTMAVTGSDKIGLTGVALTIDGQAIGPGQVIQQKKHRQTGRVVSQTVQWSLQLTAGRHTLQAIITDTANQLYRLVPQSVVVETPTPPVVGDLTVAFVIDPPAPQAGQPAIIQVTVTGSNLSSAQSVSTQLTINSQLLDSRSVPLPTGSTQSSYAFNWTPPIRGAYHIQLTVDPMGLIKETNEANNTVSYSFTIAPRWPPPGPGYTEFKLLGPSLPPRHDIVTALLPILLGRLRIDEQDRIWTLPEFARIKLPEGKIDFGPVHFSNNFSFAIDRLLRFWVSSDESPSPIYLYSQTGELINQFNVGTLGISVADIDQDGFVYVSTSDLSIRKKVARIFDTQDLELIRDPVDRSPVQWPIPGIGLFYEAMIPDGINLWVNLDGLYHLNRITGEVIHFIDFKDTKNAGRFTIGPQQEILVSHGNRLFALDPQASDDSSPLWEITLERRIDFIYQRHGILAIVCEPKEGEIAASVLVVKHF